MSGSDDQLEADAAPRRGRTPQYEAKREAFVRAAVEELNRKGVRGMTLGDVAARLNLVPTGVIYYFKSKEELAAAAFLKGIARFDLLIAAGSAGGDDPADRVHALVHAYFAFKREVAAGRVVDLEARLQERLRLPLRVIFRDRDEAAIELLGLLGEDGATLPVDQPFARGDRLTVDVVAGGRLLLSVDALVRRLQTQDGKGCVIVTALDDAARVLVGEFLDADPVGRKGQLNRRA